MMFNHLKHKCFHCSLFFSSIVNCVGVETVVPKLAVKLATKKAALSNIVPVRTATCLADVVKSNATDCTVHSKHMATLECHVCDVAEGADVSCAK